MRVLLFAQVRELIGSETLEISLANPSEVSARQIIDKVAEAVSADAALRTLLDRSMVAIDNEYVMQPALPVQIGPNSEVAIIPPVSGG